MKLIQYIGDSKLTKRIVDLLNHKAPMPLDGNGDNDWGTNGQVLTTDGNGNTSWTTPQGGGGDVTDVEVNGTSVVNAQGVAEVSVPTATSDLNNDSGFIDGTDLSTALSDYTPTSSLATVATSGDYDDLTNKPTIPAAQVQSDWSQADNTQVDYIKNKPSIPTALADLTDDSTHRVVTDTQISTWNGKSDFSGSYNDLTDKPTIPTVNDGTLTIQQNGTTLGTFTANQSGNTTVNLTGGGSTYTEGDGIDISSQNEISVDTAFTEASTRANIASGDSFATILGKIKKFFTDLKTVAFTGAYADLSGTPTIPTDFVSKANGGTFSGTITVNAASDTPIRNKSSLANSTCYLEFSNAGGYLGWFAVTNAKQPCFQPQGGSLKELAYKSDIPDISTKVSKSGDTMTGELTMNKTSGDSMYTAYRTDSGVGISMGVGSGGVNHGLYSRKLDKWIIHADASNVYVEGDLNGNAATASAVKDSGNSTNTTFAYSKAGLNYSQYTWLAGWNGYELRAINKAQFAKADDVAYEVKTNFLSTVVGSGYSTSNDYSEFMRYGKIVLARFNLKMSSQQATRTSRGALGGVSAQFKPSVDTASVAQIFCGSTYVNAAFVFLSNGSIRVDTFDVAIPANTWMDVICIYGLRS